MFAQIWTGCDCPDGETWQIEIGNHIDVDRDTIGEEAFCTVCGKSVSVKKLDDEGRPVMHVLTDSEIEEIMFFNPDGDGDPMDS